MNKILITGANSYIGNSVKDYLSTMTDSYLVDVIDTFDLIPNQDLFSSYDIVFNVAGIAHVKECDENKELYYKVNRDLAIEIARVAKDAGVRQYILLSSMAVYGKLEGHISKETKPNPNTYYGKSKYEADVTISKLESPDFIFTCLRPPMVYGKGCKGNYQIFRRLSMKVPIFPKIDNVRSMIYIGNLCEFVKECIDEGRSGIFFPQNSEYVNTSNMFHLIAKENNKKVILTKSLNPIVFLLKRLKIVKKCFGSLTYSVEDCVDKYCFEESIHFTENISKDI